MSAKWYIKPEFLMHPYFPQNSMPEKSQIHGYTLPTNLKSENIIPNLNGKLDIIQVAIPQASIPKKLFQKHNPN